MSTFYKFLFFCFFFFFFLSQIIRKIRSLLEVCLTTIQMHYTYSYYIWILNLHYLLHFTYTFATDMKRHYYLNFRSLLSKSDQANGTKQTKRSTSCNGGGLALYTHPTNQLYVIGISIEFFLKMHQICWRNSRLELDRFQNL